MVSEQTIKEFQEAVKDEYGVILETAEAIRILSNWVGYFNTLATIDHREKSQKS